MRYFFVLLGLIICLISNTGCAQANDPVEHVQESAGLPIDYRVDADQLDQYSTEQHAKGTVEGEHEKLSRQDKAYITGKLVGYIDLVDKSMNKIVRYDVFKGSRSGLFIYKWSPTTEGEVKRYLTAKQKEMVIYD